MSRFQAESLLLGCAADGAVLLTDPVQPGAAVDILATLPVERSAGATAAGLAAALPGLQLDTRVAAGQKCALTVTLDDGLCRSFVVTPPRGARGLRELRASAAARFAALYGESAEQWLVVADWHALAPFVASALPRALWQALQQLAQTRGWRLASVSPAFVRVGNRLCASIPADGCLLVGFAQTLTLLATRADQVAGLRSLRLAAAPDLAELETLLEQELLRLPAATERGRQSLLWAGAADWLPAAATLAGVASRVIPSRRVVTPAGGQSTAGQLASAGSCR
ncbi:hypothetical protein [Candidatus Accumulibacter sp. ACC003]|uniref:hypothetical protein n=1 Tax=Candidatus Accumulibacter sp. ACC003 TaxID=2823334 RepID=UPI0025BAAEC3|nr:hypothetical protein [Candidatus Accumulibacter sp. ACC003]